MKLKARAWRYKQYLLWLLKGRKCHCGADQEGHREGFPEWCVYYKTNG